MMALSGGLKLSESIAHNEEGRSGRFALASVQAAALNPLSMGAREIMAVAFSYASVDPAIALDIVQNALNSDPNSPKLLWLKVAQELRLGEFESAEATLLRLESIAPQMEQTHTARRVFDEMAP